MISVLSCKFIPVRNVECSGIVLNDNYNKTQRHLFVSLNIYIEIIFIITF